MPTKKVTGSKRNTPNEIWKSFPIKEFRTKYGVSNLGNIRNSETKHILKHCIRSGYKSHCYETKNIRKQYKVHRVVAMRFVPNDDPENKIWVNHINGNKLDCRASNLEWCTPSENNTHAIDTGLNPKTEKAVIRYNPDTEMVKLYESILGASKDTGISDGSICNALSGRRKLAGGYEWCYIEENQNNQSDVDLSQYKQIDGFPNYLINAEGNIYSLPYKRFLKYQSHQLGGKQLQLVNGDNKKDFLVHRLVALYFLKKKNKNDNSIHHIDKDKTNNSIDNLEWCNIPGVEASESKYHTQYYNPETAIKPAKKKSIKSAPKDLLTANPRNLSKKQREERNKLLKKQSGSKTNNKLTSNT